MSDTSVLFAQNTEEKYEKIMNTLNSIKNRQFNELSGLSTGFTDLDKITAGLQVGDLIIFASSAGMGKTAFALNIAENVVLNQKKPVAIFSFDMSAEYVAIRIMASRLCLSTQKLRQGQLNPADWKKITYLSQQIAKSPLYIEDNRILNIMDVCKQARQLAKDLKAKKTPLALIAIDYLQLIYGSLENCESRQYEILEIMHTLKNLAIELKVPIIALSQIPNGLKGLDRGNYRHFLDSKEFRVIEHYADLVAFVHREYYYNRKDPDIEKDADVIIAKQKNGPMGQVALSYESEFGRFYNKP